jgi:transposase
MSKTKYYSTEEVAEVFGRTPKTIRNWISKGCPTPNGLVKLDACKLGKSWEVKDEWLALFEFRVRPHGGRPDLDLE